MFPYRIILGQLAFKITVGTAEKKKLKGDSEVLRCLKVESLDK